MNILVIDSKGGGMGHQLVAAIKANFPQATVLAVGTNVMATRKVRHLLRGYLTFFVYMNGGINL